MDSYIKQRIVDNPNKIYDKFTILNKKNIDKNTELFNRGQLNRFEFVKAI